MIPTKESVQARLEKLQSEQVQLQNNFHAYSGAIQECQFWLDQLSAEEEKKEQ